MCIKKLILLILIAFSMQGSLSAQTQQSTFFLQTDFDELFMNDSFKISKCLIYLSNFKFYNQSLLVFEDKAKAHLIDLIDPSPLQFIMPKNLQYNWVEFNIGIDSSTSAAGVLTGDLDPRKGMYWAWQSGYINFNAIQTNSFEVYPNNKYTLSFNFMPMLQYCLAQKQYEIMSPQLKAVQLAKLLSENTTCTKVQNLSNE